MISREPRMLKTASRVGDELKGRFIGGEAALGDAGILDLGWLFGDFACASFELHRHHR